VRRALDRWILLGSAEARAEALPVSRRARAARLFVGARARRDAALAERGVAALILARSAVHAYLDVVATLTADAPPEAATMDTLWTLHDTAVANGRLPPLSATFDEARRCSLVVQPYDDEVAEHGELRTDEALALVAYFAHWIDLRSPRRIRLERRARQLSLSVAVALVFAVTLQRRPHAPSVSMHAAAVTSSRRPATVR
jgi:hypothetical protein